MVSEQGVTAHLVQGAEDVVLIVPSELLHALAVAWQKDEQSTGPIVTAVRDLFDGQDGELRLLHSLFLGTKYDGGAR